MHLLQVGFELLLQRLGVFFLVGAVTSSACVELNSGTSGAFSFDGNGPKPFRAAESGLFCWHFLRVIDRFPLCIFKGTARTLVLGFGDLSFDECRLWVSTGKSSKFPALEVFRGLATQSAFR